ncbi:uncharacterized protein LOC144819573 [Lissotriton helveticus]
MPGLCHLPPWERPESQMKCRLCNNGEEDMLHLLCTCPTLLQLKVYWHKAIWRAIARKVRSLSVSNRRHTHCHKRWDDICLLSKKVAEITLGVLPRSGRLARKSMIPLISRILAVTRPALDGRLRAHPQQVETSTEGTGQGTDTSGEASGMAAIHELTDTDMTSALKGDRSALDESCPETPTSTSSDSSGDSSMLAGTGSSKSASSSTTHRPVSTLPDAPTSAVCACCPRKSRVSLPPGTAAPAPVCPAALSVEAVHLLRQLCVGQAALLNAFQDHDKNLAQVVAFMEGFHSYVRGLHRTVQSLSSTVTTAIQQSQAPSPAPVPSATTLPVAPHDESVHMPQPSGTKSSTHSTQQQHSKRPRPQTPSPKHKTGTQGRKGKSPSGDTQWHKAKKQASTSHSSESPPSKGTPIPTPAPTDKQTVVLSAVNLMPVTIQHEHSPTTL